MSHQPPYLPGQGNYDEYDENEIREELREREEQRQKNYSKAEEKEIKEELDNKTEEEQN